MSNAFDSVMPEIDNTPTKNFLDDTAADVASKFARHHNQALSFGFRSKHLEETGMLSGEAAVTEVTAWLRKLEAGHGLAAERLWDVFFERLVRLAQDRMRANDRRIADAEDVALSAFASFCRGCWLASRFTSCCICNGTRIGSSVAAASERSSRPPNPTPTVPPWTNSSAANQLLNSPPSWPSNTTAG